MTLDSQESQCFVCGPSNEHGLGVTFWLSDDNSKCFGEWTSSQPYVGYDTTTHGGILFCLLDDVMANLFSLQGYICVTAKASVRFHHPLDINETVRLESNLVTRKRNLVIIDATATKKTDGLVVASSTGHFMLTGQHGRNV